MYKHFVLLTQGNSRPAASHVKLNNEILDSNSWYMLLDKKRQIGIEKYYYFIKTL